MKILHLSLKAKPFEVMVTGEKQVEFREPKQWILSRLFDKNGRPKEYDAVRFVNGYGADKPYFVAKYIGNYRAQNSYDDVLTYSNGFKVCVRSWDVVIQIGEIIEKGNLK